MTVLTVLLALLIAHFVRGLDRFRKYQVPVSSMAWLQNQVVARWPEQGWLGVLVLVAVVFPVVALLQWLAGALPGTLGLFLLGLLALLYTIGPEDLDRDVEAIAEAESTDEQRRRMADIGRPDQPPAARVFSDALWRWFGIIFWFAVLGVVGAVLFRLAEQSENAEARGEASLARAMSRLRAILAWPVAQLMSLALMLAADFDRSFLAWKAWMDRHGWLTPGDGMLLSAGLEAADRGEPVPSVIRAMELCWRMLIIWLVLLSLVQIAGWII